MASKKRSWFWGTIVAITAVIFVLGSLILVNESQLYVSPDETANAYFATQFAQTGLLQGEAHPLSHLVEERIHPRSTIRVEGTLLPGSFLGLPLLYGMVSSIFGEGALPLITPLITLLTAFAAGRIVARFTNKTTGYLVSVLVLVHPAMWYYSARGLMHNVLFVDLLILSAWLYIDQPLRRVKKQRSLLNDVTVGLLFALAIMTRTSEAFWVAGALVACLAVFWKKISLQRARVVAIGVLLGGGIALLTNYLTYGDPLLTGYTAGVVVAQETVSAAQAVATKGVLPFGIHPRTAWGHLRDYGILMFWWLSLLALPGLYLLWQQKKHRKVIRSAIVIGTFVSAWIVLMYGSWEIHDNPDPTQITMANSYVRYWLPMYLLSIPMIATTIMWLANTWKQSWMKHATYAVCVLALGAASIYAVFMQGQDGLLKMRTELQESADIQEVVLKVVPEDAVIVVDRADKIFFPHREVMYPLRDDGTYASMPLLAQYAPLYYFGITFPEQDVEYLNTKKLAEMGLQITQLISFEEESLYQITWQ